MSGVYFLFFHRLMDDCWAGCLVSAQKFDSAMKNRLTTEPYPSSLTRVHRRQRHHRRLVHRERDRGRRRRLDHPGEQTQVIVTPPLIVKQVRD